VLPVNAFQLCIAGGQMFNGMRSVTMSIAEIVSSMAVIQSRNSENVELYHSPAADMAQTTNHRAINFLLVLSLTRYRFFL